MASISNVAAIAALNAVVDLVDAGGGPDANGDIVFYDGTPPANVETALSGNNELTRVELQNPAFDAASDDDPGAIADLLNTPLSDLSIDQGGTVTFCRIFDRENPNDPVVQLSVGTSGTEVIVNAATLVAGATFTITSLSLRMPES